ncbi:MAG TPA: sigma-70 family RNA polymerase sigma factor [Solirubrobacterales bacterium]
MPEPSSQDQAIRDAHEGGGRVFSGAHGAELVESAGESRTADASLARALGRSVPQGEQLSTAYLAELGGRARLTPAEERRLIIAAKDGDRRARAALVEAFMPLIGSVARLYRETVRVERIELLQEGVVGLLRALERFDPERGTPFWAFAAWWVRQAMQQLVSELTRPMVLSDRALRHLSRIRDAHQAGLRSTGLEPTRDQLALETGLTTGQVDDLLAVERPTRSLEEPAVPGEGRIGTLGDLIADPLAEDEYEQVLKAVQVEELLALLSVLSERERAILRDRFGLQGGEEQSRKELAESLGISVERVRQVEQRALAKLAAAAGVRS